MHLRKHKFGLMHQKWLAIIRELLVNATSFPVGGKLFDLVIERCKTCILCFRAHLYARSQRVNKSESRQSNLTHLCPASLTTICSCVTCHLIFCPFFSSQPTCLRAIRPTSCALKEPGCFCFSSFVSSFFPLPPLPCCPSTEGSPGWRSNHSSF